MRQPTIGKLALVPAIKARVPFLSEPAIGEVYDNLLRVIASSLMDGTPVRLEGIGTLLVKDCSARLGFDPVNKVKVSIPATKRVRFKQSITL